MNVNININHLLRIIIIIVIATDKCIVNFLLFIINYEVKLIFGK
jgi:hypothetical protein